MTIDLMWIGRKLVELQGDMRGMREDMREVKDRLLAIEGGMTGLDASIVVGTRARQRVEERMDHMEDRMRAIEDGISTNKGDT